ncbi:MAG: alkaline phosphatase family protein [Oscillospiraceae bacterium]|nr:alkaline phosphatase family protein [Oscillospiraceae bacterium]
MNDITLPDYDNCLVGLANSVLERFGAATLHDTLPLADRYLYGGHKNVVVLLLDAMGISIMEEHLDKDGAFRSHLAGSFHSVYPPTTVAATTSLISGLYPNEHGWLGWDVYFPQLDKNVTVYRNTDQMAERPGAVPGADGWDASSLEEERPAADYNAAFRYAPYRMVNDLINDAGGTAYWSSPFMPPYPADIDAVLDRISTLCSEPGEKYIYAYWNEPDGTMHGTGTKSRDSHEVIVSLEEKVARLASSLKDTLLIVTADHGHMDSRNVCILDYPDIMECLVRMPSIEPRTLSLFVKDRYKDSFPEIFKRHFGDSFRLLTREEALSSHLFGTGKDRDGLGDMLGDYIALAVSDVSVFNTHYEAQMMPGGHAGLTPEEYIIPLIVFDQR